MCEGVQQAENESEFVVAADGLAEIRTGEELNEIRPGGHGRICSDGNDGRQTIGAKPLKYRVRVHPDRNGIGPDSIDEYRQTAGKIRVGRKSIEPAIIGRVSSPAESVGRGDNGKVGIEKYIF
jgi:hypothetical protein